MSEVANKLSNYLTSVSNKLYNASPRPALRYVTKLISDNWYEKNIYFVELPTGYGKTTLSIALSLLNRDIGFKIIIAYPVRSLLEDQYVKFKKFFDDSELGVRYMHNPESRYLIKPVTLTTIDTLSLVMFGLAPEDVTKAIKYYTWTGTNVGSPGHYLFSRASYALSDIILDEAHLLADTTKSLNYLMALIKYVIHNEQRLFILSATIPKALKDKILNILGALKDRVIIAGFSTDQDPEFIKSRSHKKYRVNIDSIPPDSKYNRIYKWLLEACKDIKNRGLPIRAIIVFNTVKDAVGFYNYICIMSDSLIPRNKFIIHSRFTEYDRRRKINQLLNSKDSEYVIISTQVIEVGVDISSNIFISEIAPAASLIQRLGRFLRYDEDYGVVLIWYEEFLKDFRNSMYKVYDGVITSSPGPTPTANNAA